MTDAKPFPSAAELIAALQRLDCDLVAGLALAQNDVGRARLRDRIRRIEARVRATATDQFPDHQREMVAVRMVVLNEWAAMLEALHPANDLD